VSITELNAVSRLRQPQPRTRPNRGLPHDYDVVARRVNRRSALLANVAKQLPLVMGQLHLDGPLVSTGDRALPSWEAAGRLYGVRSYLRKSTRVEIELSAWSPRSSELRLRPVTRRVASWGRRRQRRYFRFAHRSADEVARWLDAAVRRSEVTIVLEERSVASRRLGDEAWPLVRAADLH
jgi:hypothetical protein